LAGEGSLDLKVTDLGATQLKNIAEPVRVYSLEVGQPAEAKPPSSMPADAAKSVAANRRWASTPLAAAIAALLILAAAGGWYVLGGRLTKPAQAGHLSIVVLPFANLSGDPSQDYFADGVTENLTTELSHIRDSLVIARNTAFTYRGKSIDAKEIGKGLNVRYVLEGSVQRDQNRVRVNAARRRRVGHASLGRPFRGGRSRPVQAARSSCCAIGQHIGDCFDQGRSRKGRSFEKSGCNRSDHARLDFARNLPKNSATPTIRREPCSTGRSKLTRTTLML